MGALYTEIKVHRLATHLIFFSFPGILGVCMTGFILHSLGSSLLVFLLSAVSNLIALVLYVAFGSGHRLQFDAR